MRSQLAHPSPCLLRGVGEGVVAPGWDVEVTFALAAAARPYAVLVQVTMIIPAGAV